MKGYRFMKNSFGNNITVTLFGESHGEAIGCVIDGLAPGIVIDEAAIDAALAQRRGEASISTARREGDAVSFLSGVKDGVTEGTPVCLVIKNECAKRDDYSALAATPRPSHADYAAECKYHGYQDASGGGHFSGRLTAPIVAAGAIIAGALKERGIYIGTHVLSLGGVRDRDFSDLCKDIEALDGRAFPVLDEAAALRMRAAIAEARAEGDSIGGVLECAVIGMPEGVGEPWFDTVEGLLAHAYLSIPAVKGVEFGRGFALADMRGSEANDELYFDTDGTVKTKTNNCGGVCGGITNGMPITARIAIKPTPSIARQMETVDLKSGENITLTVGGRHDGAIAHRACPAVTAMTAIVLADLLVTRFGTDWLGGKRG